MWMIASEEERLRGCVGQEWSSGPRGRGWGGEVEGVEVVSRDGGGRDEGYCCGGTAK